MDETSDVTNYDGFVTDFPKKGVTLVDYLQGRVHFALFDQMRFMSQSGMALPQIKDIILGNVTEIIDNFKPEKESERS